MKKRTGKASKAKGKKSHRKRKGFLGAKAGKPWEWVIGWVLVVGLEAASLAKAEKAARNDILRPELLKEIVTISDVNVLRYL